MLWIGSGERCQVKRLPRHRGAREDYVGLAAGLHLRHLELGRFVVPNGFDWSARQDNPGQNLQAGKSCNADACEREQPFLDDLSSVIGLQAPQLADVHGESDDCFSRLAVLRRPLVDAEKRLEWSRSIDVTTRSRSSASSRSSVSSDRVMPSPIVRSDARSDRSGVSSQQSALIVSALTKTASSAVALDRFELR
jgi:hypothetical protein